MEKLKNSFIKELREKLNQVGKGSRLCIDFHSSEEVDICTFDNHVQILNGFPTVDCQSDNFWDEEREIYLDYYLHSHQIKGKCYSEWDFEQNRTFLITYLETICYGVENNLVDYTRKTPIKERSFIIDHLKNVLELTTEDGVNILDNEYVELIGSDTINKVIDTVNNYRKERRN